MDLPAYSIVIATFERPSELRTTLASIVSQSHPPALIVVVDASPDDATRAVAEDCPLPIRYERAVKPSAAVQRNQGAALVTTPLVAFVDDDICLRAETFAKICDVFREDEEGTIGGISGREEDMVYHRPRTLLRCYYRLQAGFAHPTYGGKLFGAAINCMPVYAEAESDLIPSDWLPSGCVVFRTPLFMREKFPEFDGYSFMEDVHLSARIGRTHRLLFHRGAPFEHRAAPSTFKRNARALAQMRVRHQRLVAEEIVGLRAPALTWKLLLHRCFVTVAVLRRRGPGWPQEILGTWM